MIVPLPLLLFVPLQAGAARRASLVGQVVAARTRRCLTLVSSWRGAAVQYRAPRIEKGTLITDAGGTLPAGRKTRE